MESQSLLSGIKSFTKNNKIQTIIPELLEKVVGLDIIKQKGFWNDSYKRICKSQ